MKAAYRLVVGIVQGVCWGIGLYFFSFSVKAQTAQQLENLAAFSRAYGYVKYFHPSDEASAIDWGKFAMYGSEQILKAEKEDELLQSLKVLFAPIAPGVRFQMSGQETFYDHGQLTPSNQQGYKIIYWQHFGLGKDMGNPSELYQSVRVGRREMIDKSDKFGNILMSLDAAPVLGKRIKFSGRVKMQPGTAGTGHLWLRVDLQDDQIGFFNNMDENPVVKGDWDTYEIIGTVDQSAKRVVMGSFLLGKGGMFVDDLQLSYEEDGQWHSIPNVDGGFENGDLTDENPDNTWRVRGNGYTVEVVSDPNLLNNHMAHVQHVGIYTSKTPSELFKVKPDKGEIWTKDIGRGVTMMMPLSLYADEEHTFPQADPVQLQKLDNGLKSIAFSPVDLPFRLGNVINTWNVFQHFYPYFEEVEVDWNAALIAAIQESFEDKDDHETSLQRLVAKVKDGHVQVTKGMDNYFAPPITWEWVEDQLVITDVFDPELGIKVGDRVSHIDGVEAEDYFEKIHQRISSPTVGWRSYRANIVSILGPLNSEILLVVEGQDKLLKRDLFYYREAEQRRSLKEGYRFLDNDVVYLNLDILPLDSIKALLPRLQQSRAIIADLRGYPNGNHELITHLLSTKDTKEWMHVPQIVYPDRDRLENYKSFGWSLKPQKPYLGDKKVVFITDGSAISYAESYMGFIEGYRLATIVGQPTAGTNGNINQFQLPGGYFITFTGMKVKKHDGSPLHGVGILPDVYVEKSLKGVKEGRDEFLEAALRLANEE